MKHLVKVVIPVYKKELKDWELLSLENNMKVLSSHPIVILKPEGLDLSSLFALPFMASASFEVMEVTTEWLGDIRGIEGYNVMMMSEAFYRLFADTEYMFICHFDAWIFRDELEDWCKRGYDMVAAPWPKRPCYNHFPMKQYLWLKAKFSNANRIHRQQMFGKIGNGGLCLRKVSTFQEVCRKYASEIAYFNSQEDPLYNEDIFFAMVPKELIIPSVEEALAFGYDLKPEVCHKLNHGKMPMGCHGFMHKRRVAFWRTRIPELFS